MIEKKTSIESNAVWVGYLTPDHHRGYHCVFDVDANKLILKNASPDYSMDIAESLINESMVTGLPRRLQVATLH